MMKSSENQLQEIAIPQVLVDACLRKKGLILIVGNRFSHVDKTLVSLKKRGEQFFTGASVCLAREEFAELEKYKFTVCSYGNMSEAKTRKLMSESSVLVFENVLFEDELTAAVNFCEEGRLVILHVSSSSIINALHRIYGLALQTQNPHLLWRVIDNLNLLFSQTTIVNAKMETAFAHELVLASSEVKKCLWQGQLSEFEELMKNSGENSGIVTMNQSLLQLIIRRRIEIKTAFEICRDPVDLDHLLKKVGV